MAGGPRSQPGRIGSGRQVKPERPGPAIEPAPVNARQAAVVQLGSSDRGRVVLVRVGAVIDVRLPAQATQPESSDTHIVDVVPRDQDDENPEECHARFLARTTGEATLLSTIHTGSRTGVTRRWSVLLTVGDDPAGAPQVPPPADLG